MHSATGLWNNICYIIMPVDEHFSTFPFLTCIKGRYLFATWVYHCLIWDLYLMVSALAYNHCCMSSITSSGRMFSDKNISWVNTQSKWYLVLPDLLACSGDHSMLSPEHAICRKFDNILCDVWDSRDESITHYTLYSFRLKELTKQMLLKN